MNRVGISSTSDDHLTDEEVVYLLLNLGDGVCADIPKETKDKVEDIQKECGMVDSPTGRRKVAKIVKGEAKLESLNETELPSLDEP